MKQPLLLNKKQTKLKPTKTKKEIAWLYEEENTITDFTGLCIISDYLLLSDRKSETYAIKLKNVDFTTSQITIGKALDKFGNEKSTKGSKTTISHIPNELKQFLQQWKVQQKEELAQFEIEQTEEQLLFTFFDDKGNINQRLHTDYLNYRMKSIERRHKHLTLRYQYHKNLCKYTQRDSNAHW